MQNYIKTNKPPQKELEYILRNFDYNRDTGELTRLDRENSNGSIDKDGYVVLKINDQRYRRYQIVWLLCTGEFPDGEIDHIDRDRTNDNFDNLRRVTRSQNLKNRNAYKHYIGGQNGKNNI